MIYTHCFEKNKLPQKTADFIINRLKDYLQAGPSLLLLSGGSVARDVVPQLVVGLTSLSTLYLSRLTIALVDERFGRPWHKESNMLLLKSVGLVKALDDKKVDYTLPLLLADSLSGAASAYNGQMQKLFAKCQGRIIGIFGIGLDGHTAGIKPQPDEPSYEKLFSGQKLIVGYKGPDYKRITLTPYAVRQVSVAVIYATGEEKRTILTKLLQTPTGDEFRFSALVFHSLPQTHLLTDIS